MPGFSDFGNRIFAPLPPLDISETECTLGCCFVVVCFWWRGATEELLNLMEDKQMNRLKTCFVVAVLSVLGTFATFQTVTSTHVLWAQPFNHLPCSCDLEVFIVGVGWVKVSTICTGNCCGCGVTTSFCKTCTTEERCSSSNVLGVGTAKCS